MSNYLDRVYADERILHPLVARGRRASGARRWDEALDRVAERLLRARDELGGESILPVQLHGHAGADPGQLDVAPA